MARQRLVIIGAGFAGTQVAKQLKNEDIDILLIDRVNHHISQPLLYQVATGALSTDEIAISTRDMFAKQENCEIRLATVIGVDKEKKLVILDTNETISYDYLVIAPGARHSYFGHPTWEQYAPGLKTAQEALNIRDQILSSFEKAEQCAHNKEEREKWMTFVIIGGGPHGIALAGALAEVALKSLVHKYKEIDTTKAKVYLIEALPRILPALSEKISQEALKNLETLGVQVLTSSPVVQIDKERVDMKDRSISAGTIMWAAGNEAPTFLKTLNTPLDKQGRVIVQSDLSIEHHREIFVIGDAACCLDVDKKPLPGLVFVAKQQASYVASLITQHTPPEERKGFSYFDLGFIASISRGKAVGEIRSRFVKGFFAWFLWLGIQIGYLTGFECRLFVLMRWIPLYIAHRRHAMIIE